MRSVWNGVLRVELVAVPVGLAVTAAQNKVAFRTLHRDCGTPVRQKRECPEHGEIGPDDAARGFEFAKGQYVLVEERELAQLDTREITVQRFVRAGGIDPLLRDRVYWLVPPADHLGRRAYRLLADAIDDAGVAGLCKLTLWNAERVAAVEARDGMLSLTLLFVPSELRSPADQAALVALEQATDRECELAGRLIRRMTERTFDPASLEHAGGRQLRDLVDAKIAGRDVVIPEPENVAPLDLADALRQSLARARKNTRRAARTPGRARAAPAARR